MRQATSRLSAAAARAAFAAFAACLGLAAAGAARAQTQAQSFALEGAVIDSRNARNLGVISERGDINGLFRAQKAMTFGILRSAGISLEQLPADVRARIERFQTQNVEAFRAFSQGLDLKDQGKFIEAAERFRRAAELDPGFALAGEQQRAMPDVNLGVGVQTRAVMLAAAGTAVERGRATIAIDAGRAASALAAGLTVVNIDLPASTEAALDGYTVNPAGSSTQLLPNLAVALTFPIVTSSGLVFELASANEYRADDYRITGSVLDSAGSLASGFLAQRQNAGVVRPGSLALADGSTAYWGTWLSAPGSSAVVTAGGNAIAAPTLGNVDYVFGDATRAMPTAGTAQFNPAGGPLGAVTGRIAVDFVNRSVAVQNLGFAIGSLAFSGLNGSATYASTSASGAFNGSYTSGSCAGCAAFTPSNSSFGGNFVGRNADGLVFSTFLLTGPTTSVSGVHLFTR